ncbi:cell adhesion molecule CEACAM20 [Spinachia spinachia]
MDVLAVKPLVLLLLCFVGCCAPTGVLLPGPIDAVLGGNVTIKTVGTTPDFIFILWGFNDGSGPSNIVTGSKDGVKVNDPFKGRASMNATTGDLSIGPLTSQDSGDYDISFVSSTGTVMGGVKLRVLEPVSDVSIKSSLSEAIEHNSTVVLTCSAKGSFLQFRWLRGDTPVVDDGNRFSVKNGELSSNLTIKDVLRTDLVGPIYCTAANKLQLRTSAPFNLTVYYGPDDVTISPLSPPKFISSKENFSLSCSAVSSPPADFLWYRDQQQMELMGPKLTLEVINAHSFGNKAGEYMCKAQNKKTNRKVSAGAVVIAVIEPVSSAEVSGPATTLIAGNGTANISCRAAGGSVDATKWLKDQQPLAAGGRLLFSADMSSLRIDPLQKEDNGEYTCQLLNAVSSAKAAYKMVVNYGPEQAAVQGEKAVEVNDKVALDCSAPSIPPANFTWKFNSTMTNVKTARYVIDMALYKNTGTYTCEAHNVVTGKTAASSHFLSVKEEGALDDGLSDGAIAGIVIAVLVALGAAIAVIIYCRQKVPVESPY